jgi:hypothetical protein
MSPDFARCPQRREGTRKMKSPLVVNHCPRSVRTAMTLKKNSAKCLDPGEFVRSKCWPKKLRLKILSRKYGASQAFPCQDNARLRKGA